jgi:hypothetical protein
MKVDKDNFYALPGVPSFPILGERAGDHEPQGAKRDWPHRRCLKASQHWTQH